MLQSKFQIDFEHKNVQVFQNCNPESVQRALKHPVGRDYFRIGGSQNFFEFLYPTEMTLDAKYFL